MYTKTIFWFRQDLRIQDNTGLYQAVNNSESVLPIFILDENIIDGFGGLSDQKFGFIREALDELSGEIQKLGGEGVQVFVGKPEEILPELVEKYGIEKVYTNKSYGSYGVERDEQVKTAIEPLGCEFEGFKDFLIAEPHEVEQRKVFTPFYKLWQKYILAGNGVSNGETFELLEISTFSQLLIGSVIGASEYISLEKHPYFTMEFGKKRFSHHITSDYDDVRNQLDKDGTSRLSPYLRFGIFSIRQIYNMAYKVNQHFISELAWREFWWHIKHYFPFTVQTEFQERKRHIKWSHDKELFDKWCKGETGYPVVDAAMRQLNETNWMHGRARMIVASFLTKDLHIDWRWGEAYFREKLLDYDQGVNIGNWQWSASVGADPKPLRIFNPILQSTKFDPEAKYIKTYIPELEFETIKAIHDPLKYPLTYQPTIVDHAVEQRRTRAIYKGEEV